MHIRKYDAGYSRRQFMERTAKGIAAAGVLQPLWPLIANAQDTAKAYPEELRSLDAYTKGKVKEGDIVDASNVDLVKDLLDPISYKQIKEMGRRIKVAPTTRDVTKLYNTKYLEATVRNAGKAKFDASGNVVTEDGKRWIGGNPFPNAKTGVEVYANLTLSWGRNDQAFYAVRDWDITPSGNVAYQYDFCWAEENVSGRVNDTGKPYVDGGFEDMLRFQSVFFTSPNDVKGTSFLSNWFYDQTKFPDLFGYLPAFKRERRFPTNQRFEPLVPGITLFLSDAWHAGDPMLTWGNYKIVETKPHLGVTGGNWHGDQPNWEPPVHGGPKGLTFYEYQVEFIPEVLVIESEPTGYPRAPVGKRRTYVDVRNMMSVGCNTYDRRGELWKTVDAAFGRFERGDLSVKDGNGEVVWSVQSVMCHDIQANRMSRFYLAQEIPGGYKCEWNQGSLYERYLTIQAIRRLGST
ncbi:DUF1329 domain-containing protein [Zavarzinia aquatilis]|uniref:DUF1329 domain-containing protein n=1 Tax=Zavarzinia aquatilis TaxID=2211142 RepID=A0A317E4H8_9PROT|nr:DUF1329 domain-containing protein [Zavarzinia aquatilis]PWR20303.1 hypothetical protein DKG74_14950 [Zavarzinia aquatilis]